MKKDVFLIFLVFLFLPVFLFAKEKTNSTKEIVIEKRQDPNQPRTPDYACDITAYYQSGVIYLNFGGDMGEVEITVTNETTGEQWSQTGDTAFGAAAISISTNAGDYSIMITTGDSHCYSGYFSL